MLNRRDFLKGLVGMSTWSFMAIIGSSKSKVYSPWKLTVNKGFDYYWNGKPIASEDIGEAFSDHLLSVPKGESFNKYRRKGLDPIV